MNHQLPEPYPGYTDEARKREERIAAIERGHAAVLPGALREAFAGEPIVAGSHRLQAVTLGLTANLERIKSPLLDVVRIMREVLSAPENKEMPIEGKMTLAKSRIEKETQLQEEQIAETVFVFTRPQKRIRKLLDAGRDKFREAAMEELGDKLHPAQMAALQRACSQHYVASFATIIGYGTPSPEEGAAVFPPPSPSEATGSVGGSAS
jgi:hypothetical protein